MRTILLPITRGAIAAAMLCCAVSTAVAQEKPAAGTLRIAGGPTGKIYELMIRDMQMVCGAKVPLQSVASTGGLQNLSALSASEAELGIVQLDTLRAMKGGDENIDALQAVMPLHNNLLHVLALDAGSRVGVKVVMGVPLPGTGTTIKVRKFSELKGLSVALVGSAQLMGQQLESQLGYGMQFLVAENDDAAVAMLRANMVQAVFTLGGWPLPTVARHTVADGLLLVDFDLTPQSPYISVKRSYQKLDAFNRSFLAVPNLLLTRPFKPNGAMGKRVEVLQACLRERLDELQEGHYQSAWKEIKDPDNTYGVPRYSTAPSTPVARVTK